MISLHWKTYPFPNSHPKQIVHLKSVQVFFDLELLLKKFIAQILCLWNNILLFLRILICYLILLVVLRAALITVVFWKLIGEGSSWIVGLKGLHWQWIWFHVLKVDFFENHILWNLKAQVSFQKTLGVFVIFFQTLIIGRFGQLFSYSFGRIWWWGLLLFWRFGSLGGQVRWLRNWLDLQADCSKLMLNMLKRSFQKYFLKRFGSLAKQFLEVDLYWPEQHISVVWLQARHEVQSDWSLFFRIS